MSFSLRATGDWKDAGAMLRNLAQNITAEMSAKLYEDGELVLEVMKGHIKSQDLNWTPLSKKTVELKNGDETIYVETGHLYDNLSVRRIKSSKKGSTVFIGASPWKTHTPSGKKFSDIMIWLEYGTTNMPPRPLLAPSFEEAKKIVGEGWEDVISNLVRG